MDPRAARLRETFDRAFARAPASDDDEKEDFLLVRTGGAPYALRMAEITGVAARRTIVPVPGRRAELLGLAGIRGSLVCVYSLCRLLGQGSATEDATWLALAALGDDEPVGLAFEALEGFLRVTKVDVHATPDAQAGGRARSLVQAGASPRPVIDLSTILAVIQKSAGTTGPTGSPP
jgi:chemotaxis signal transduction protein